MSLVKWKCNYTNTLTRQPYPLSDRLIVLWYLVLTVNLNFLYKKVLNKNLVPELSLNLICNVVIFTIKELKLY